MLWGRCSPRTGSHHLVRDARMYLGERLRPPSTRSWSWRCSCAAALAAGERVLSRRLRERDPDRPGSRVLVSAPWCSTSTTTTTTPVRHRQPRRPDASSPDRFCRLLPELGVRLTPISRKRSTSPRDRHGRLQYRTHLQCASTGRDGRCRRRLHRVFEGFTRRPVSNLKLLARALDGRRSTMSAGSSSRTCSARLPRSWGAAEPTPRASSTTSGAEGLRMAARSASHARHRPDPRLSLRPRATRSTCPRAAARP